MNIRDFKFPKVTDLDMACGTFDADPALLKEAQARGFYNGHTPFNRMFGELFYKGGKLNFKEGLPEEFKTNATRYLKSFMGSFAPQHEDKEAICALLLSELVEEPKQ